MNEFVDDFERCATRQRRPTICDGIVYDWRIGRAVRVSASRNAVIVHEAEFGARARGGAATFQRFLVLMQHALDVHDELAAGRDPLKAEHDPPGEVKITEMTT